jgi:hypothetical protein
MKFQLLIVLFCTIEFTVYSQRSNESITLSSWIGKIKMGDANPELVFNIFKDSLGQLAGNLGIPSKGIQGIPLSKVHIDQDSIVLEISAAQASYKGIFKNNSRTINGIWTEPNLLSPLILVPSNKEIDYDDFKKENPSSLNLGFTSEHFNFYSEEEDEEDEEVLENLSKTLESNYSRISKDMQTSFDSKIDVFIYPELKAFHTAINYPDAPDWAVGAASKNELKMVSPLNPGNAHTYESLMKAIVHELAHTVVLNFRKQGPVGLPNWLNEGYAYYEAKQLTNAQRTLVHNQLLNNKIPSWNELEKADTVQFADINGYPISATIIEFLVGSYGLDKLKQFIIEPESVEKIYDMSQEDLERLWLEYLKQD